VDIKTISLLPNVLARQSARDQGAREAWFVDADGFVTEGSSSNAWIVTGEGTIVTRPAETGILRGITRTVAFDVAARHGLKVEERAFSVAEAKEAKEAFLTAASQIVMPVIAIDGHQIGNGTTGTGVKSAAGLLSRSRRGRPLIGRFHVLDAHKYVLRPERVCHLI
jgi:D-alanine transaminase